MVQRRIGNRLPRLFLLLWEAPRPGRGLDRRQPRPPASGLLSQVQDSPREATPEGRTEGWSAAWGPRGGCLGLSTQVGRFQKAEKEAGKGLGDSLCEWKKPSMLGFGDMGSDGQIKNRQRILNTPRVSDECSRKPAEWCSTIFYYLVDF